MCTSSIYSRCIEISESSTQCRFDDRIHCHDKCVCLHLKMLCCSRLFSNVWISWVNERSCFPHRHIVKRRPWNFNNIFWNLNISPCLSEKMWMLSCQLRARWKHNEIRSHGDIENLHSFTRDVFNVSQVSTEHRLSPNKALCASVTELIAERIRFPLDYYSLMFWFFSPLIYPKMLQERCVVVMTVG